MDGKWVLCIFIMVSFHTNGGNCYRHGSQPGKDAEEELLSPQATTFVKSHKEFSTHEVKKDRAQGTGPPPSRNKEQDALREFKVPAEDPQEAGISISKGSYFGAYGDINVWRPSTRFNSQQTASRIKLTRDSSSIEAGFYVSPRQYQGSLDLRFYTSWTAGHSGCYNLVCEGFISTSRYRKPGITITKFSQFDGDQVMASLEIFKGRRGWWVRLGRELVGYWPFRLFPNFQSADTITWGGIILNFNNGITCTMGSGFKPVPKKNLYGRVSFIDHIQMYDDGSAKLKTPKGNDVHIIVTHPDYYPLILDINERGGHKIFYGGPLDITWLKTTLSNSTN